MGIKLVTSALGPSWAGLSDRARIALIHMAYRAHDTGTPTTPARVWWGGADALAVDLFGADPSMLEPPQQRTVRKKIQRVIQELREAGAVRLLEAGSRGMRSQYLVLPESYPQAKQQSTKVIHNVDNPVDNPVDNSPGTPKPTSQKPS